MIYDVIIIGAGITGSCIARELSKYKLNVAVLEKENDVGNKTTNANSAIIHSGYDPVPGTNKAKFNVLGNKMYDQIAEELDVPFKRIGSLTVALYDEQLETLKLLAERAKENGVEIKLLSKQETLDIEPNLSKEVKGSLLAPTCSIIDPFKLCIHTMENAVDNGVNLFLSSGVTDIKNCGDYFEIFANSQVFKSKLVINAAGNYADNIASMIEDIDWRITSRKGEYYVLDHFDNDYVKHTIFPLPSEKGKGILVSPTTSYNYIVGPSSELDEDKEDVSTDLGTLNNIKSQALDMVPNIPFIHLIREFAGTRPTCTRHDFVIEYSKTSNHFINVGGIESPGLVSSPAIAKYVVEQLVAPVLPLINKETYNPRVKKYLTKYNITDDDIKLNPDYSKILCSCEKVSLGEIEDVLSRSVPPHSVKGVKRRTRAGFGRCQGGFCQSKVVMILAKHYNVSPLEVPLDDEGSYILTNKIKEEK